jgi:hypothetical protein
MRIDTGGKSVPSTRPHRFKFGIDSARVTFKLTESAEFCIAEFDPPHINDFPAEIPESHPTASSHVERLPVDVIPWAAAPFILTVSTQLY